MSSTAEDELESSSSANLVPSERDRKQTEKGKQFQVQLLEDERLSAQRSWRKQLNRVENYLADETEPGKLQSERIFLESLMEILLSAHERLVKALDDLATKRVAQEKFEKMELEHSDMLKRLNQKITDLKQEKENAMSSLTAALSRRSKASNTRSAKSRLSRSSRSSAVIDRKADTAVKVAKLKTELYFADDEATKVAELRKFRLTKKLALVEAEKKAIDEVEESEFSDENKFIPPVDINMINKDELVRKYLRSQASSRTECSISTVETYISGKSKIVPPKSFSKIVPSSQDKQTDQKIEITEEPGNPAAQYPSTMNPHAHDYFTSSTPKNVQPSTCLIENSPVYLQDSKPKGMIYPQDEREITQPQTSGNVLERLADLMTQRHARELLPLPEPETFSGELLLYPTWKKSFDTIVERRTDSSSQRLYYLGRYTTGEAKESISGLLALDSEDAYLEARKILSDRFGNPYLVANAYKKKIKEWPNVPPNDGIITKSVSGWSHLQRIANNLIPYQHDVDVGLLIGANCTKAIKPREVIPGADDDPYAVQTTLGWGVIGIMNRTTANSQDNHYFCNCIVSREIDCNQTKLKTISHLVAKTQAKEVFAPAQLSKMLERDFSETSREDHALSFLDKKFLNVLESSIQHRDDGHYEMPLPLKEEGLKLPNNRTLALSRLERLKQRLKRDRKYRDHYEAFMKEMIDKGQAERVPDRERG